MSLTLVRYQAMAGCGFWICAPAAQIQAPALVAQQLDAMVRSVVLALVQIVLGPERALSVADLYHIGLHLCQLRALPKPLGKTAGLVSDLTQ